MPQVHLLGDSIFDNAAYVRGGPTVIDQVRKCLPRDWQATLGAIDGDCVADVAGQVAGRGRDVTHLVVSVGGNDALLAVGILAEPARRVGDALRVLGRAGAAFEAEYRRMVQAVVATDLPAALCTIYYPRFADPELQREAVTALTVFNDAILRAAAEGSLPVIDLRRICTEEADYANEIEPSSAGGAKIAAAIAGLLAAPEGAWRRTTIFP